MSVEKKVPEIRFKGFGKEWEVLPFEVCFANIPNNTLSRADLNYEVGMAKNIHYGDVLIKLSEVLDVRKEKLPFITSNKIVNNLKHAALQNGDIVIADAAEDSMVGKCTELFNLDEQLIFSGLHTIAVRPTLHFASKYLGYYLNSSSYHDQLLSLMQGTKVLSISKTAIQNTKVAFPGRLEEQAQIGNTFQKLDSLINQHQKKHDKLSGIKKAMLVKMFPKQDETTPEIRFKGFSGEWEEKALGVLADYANGKGHEDKQKASGKYELINLNSIAIGGGLKPSGKFIDETNSTLEENDLVMVLSDVGHGDLLGRVALIPKSNTYVLNQRVALLRPNEAISPLFLLYNINAHQSYFKKQGAGMSQLNISRGSVESFPSCVPEKKEQTKIGNYFQKIDTLINQHQQQITKLNNIKQACLSKMFV